VEIICEKLIDRSVRYINYDGDVKSKAVPLLVMEALRGRGGITPAHS
jgi:hypothetical protein